MLPELTHFSNRPIKRVRSAKQDDEPGRKPVGLWVSVEGEDGWGAWCKAENFGIGKFVHKVVPDQTAQILHISSEPDLDQFHMGFRADPSWRSDHLRDYGCIDWRLVAEEWQGIVIAPYLWERRFDSDARWYYSWDCASGCIWDHRAIAAIELIGELRPA